MTFRSYPATIPAPRTRVLAIAALMGAAILAAPLTAAHAGTATSAAVQLAQAAAPRTPAATDSTGDTVEQRITGLHASLKITADQETKWAAVAQAMRENAAAMEKNVAETRTTPPQTMTAVDDLKMYQKFAQAHVDGLKNLISSFTALYSAMPDSQKKIADAVFQTSGRKASASHG